MVNSKPQRWVITRLTKIADVLESIIPKVWQHKSQLLLIVNNLCKIEAQFANISRNDSTKGSLVLFVIVALYCTVFAELDPKAIKRSHIWAPYHAGIPAFLYYHLGFLSSQGLVLPGFSQVGCTTPINVQSCRFSWNHARKAVTQGGWSYVAMESDLLYWLYRSQSPPQNHKESTRTTAKPLFPLSGSLVWPWPTQNTQDFSFTSHMFCWVRKTNKWMY